MGNLLSVDEVAQRLQVSPHMVRQWIREGRLPVIRPSRRVVRIPEEALDDMLGNELAAQTNVKAGGRVVVIPVSQLARIVETAVRMAVEGALASASADDGADERLLTLDEVAQRCGVKRGTVYRWIREGRLPYVRLSPRAIRVPAAALRGGDR